MKGILQAHVVDGYKLGHISQYVDKTEYVGANLTPRSSKLARAVEKYFDGKMRYVGLQMALKNMINSWEDTFFSKQEDTVIKAYTRRIKNYLGSDHGDDQIDAMRELHKLGYLPIEVKSLAEGSRVDMGVPVFTVKNTDKRFFWLTNYLETYLSCMIWPVCNSASISEEYLKTASRWSTVTGAPDFWVGIACHCFAARGHRGEFDSMISGMGHLAVGNVGTDTLWAIDGMEEYYNADSDKELIGCSVNAFEHATATQRIAYYRKVLGFTEYGQAEVESLRDIYTNLYKSGIVSYVADSEDYYWLMEHGIKQVKEEILSRTEDSLGLCKAVFRPDSSPKTPLEVIVGDKEAPVGSAEYKGSLELLWENFGGTLNDKGFRVINPMVGLIYGEAIDIDMQEAIYSCMVEQGFCVSNILLGVGSWGFLDRSSRDSFNIAIKGTNSIVDGEEVSMQKTPKTAMGSKKSALGLLRVEKEDGKFVLYDQQTKEQEQQGLLETVFLDGKLVKETSLQEIRDLVKGSL